MKVIQTCARCEKQIHGEYRMELMTGPKGFRQYAVHVDCAGGRKRRKLGGRQKAEGGRLKAEGGA